ncbi:MAG TPA: hypothetical protein VGP63_22395 [Planctomycetaceae bacterium]|jgi:hypothetical protein|nr:hypothetical protein [Planctomycetaceae bacterium]
MIELWKSLSDDQMALVGCAAALLVTGTIMSLSYYIGRGRMTPAREKAGELSVIDSQAAQILPTAARTAGAKRRDAA